jgi:hypothetical protein
VADIVAVISLLFEHWRRIFLFFSITVLIVDRRRAIYAALGKSAKINILAHIAFGAFALLLFVTGAMSMVVFLSSIVCTSSCYNVLTLIFNTLITGAFLFVFALTLRLLVLMNRSKISDKVRKIFCLQMKF